jgi:L-threonylcarbamoyladenylate synthase
VLATDEEAPAYTLLPIEFVSLGSAADLEVAGRLLFAHLRELETRKVDVIFARPVSPVGVGRAIYDRLFRAAEGQVIDAEDPAALARLLAELSAAPSQGG